MSEHEQLVTLCAGLGASPEQAQVMARQLAKRCDQWVAERGMARTEAMGRLLQMVVKGRMGETVPEFPATQPPASKPNASETR
ncbi:MAG TPA: hypothetical protein PLN52_01460 [Opitutaceae bacterium]|nr:hypothetical protein [Opitutaceae bacterium]